MVQEIGRIEDENLYSLRLRKLGGDKPNPIMAKAEKFRA
jgi:hypothetical protein